MYDQTTSHFMRTILIAFLFSSLLLNAQKNTFDFRHFRMEDGLYTRKITDLCQDQDGFVWIISAGSILKYDGNNFKSVIYDSSQIISPYLMTTRSLMCDSYNKLWIAGEQVIVFDLKNNKFSYHKNDPKDSNTISNNIAYAFYEDSHNNIWVGHWSGASKYDPVTGKFKNYFFNENLFRSICEDKDGNMWFGTFRNGIYKLEIKSDTFSHYSYDPKKINGIAASHVKDIIRDRFGRLWVATWGGGLQLYDSRENKFITYTINAPPYNSRANNINSLLIDSRDNFWVGTDIGLFNFNSISREFKHIYTIVSEKKQDASFVVNTIYADQADGIWLCTADGILYHNLNANNFSSFYNEEIIPSQSPDQLITSFYEGLDHSIYIKYPTSLIHWNIGTRNFIKKEPCNIVVQDYKKRFWITYPFEIAISQPYDLEIIVHRVPVNKGNNSLLSANIMNIISNNSDIFYISYKDKFFITVFDLNKKSFKHIQVKDIVPPDFNRTDLNSISVDSDNNLWLQFFGVYFRYDTRQNFLRKIDCSQYHIPPRYLKFYNDKKGNSWLIFDNVLGRYDKQKDSFIIIPPLVDKKVNINNFVITKDEAIWLSSDMGIISYNPITKKTVSFNKTDGLPTNNISSVGICIDNMLVFAHEKGLTVFNPDSFIRNTHIAPIYITDFQVNNRSYPFLQYTSDSSAVKLKYNQSTLNFEFAILNYNKSENNQYAYRLKGLEKDWRNSKSNRSVVYANLNPGYYEFQVKAANNDGIWNEKGACLTIIIRPPFWKTWWFYIFVCLTIIGVIIIIFQIRTQSIRLQNQILEDTVEKRTAQLKAQAEDLKILNSTKTKFFSIIGHDLKNPFYAINGLSSMLKDKNNEMPAEQRYEISSMIESASKNASSLLENILTWSRSQSASISMQMESINLSQIVRECFDLLQVNAEKKNIQLRLEMASDIVAHADKNAITTVIRNLINNSLKFTPDGGCITVNGYTTASVSYLSVSDTGVGMSEETIKKLFRIDENISTKGTSGEGGTGLGLIICKEFIDKNNGQIKAESRIGSGSTFTIILPAGNSGDVKVSGEFAYQKLHIESAVQESFISTKVDKIEEKEMKSFLSGLAKDDYTILVVDDNDEIRANIRQALNPYFTIKEASNGEKGINMAVKMLPDLIISDVMMPGIDGFNLCEKLKTNIVTSHIPIILLSARSAEKSKISGLQKGADDYITKPFSNNYLIAKVKNLIQQRLILRDKFSKDFILKPNDVVLQYHDSEFFNKAISVIDRNIEKFDFTIEDFCKELGMSYSQLNRKMNALTNQSPLQFIRFIRLKKAADLIKSTNLRINEIAIAVGFGEHSYFSKCFLEQFGQTPKEYETNNRNIKSDI